MLGYILKFGFLFVMIMVMLNIFLPEEAHKGLVIMSDYSDIQLVTLEKALSYATEFTENTFSEVKEQINNILSKD